MKKFLTAILALVIVISFAGCNSASDSAFYAFDQNNSYFDVSESESVSEEQLANGSYYDSAAAEGEIISENSSVGGRKLIVNVSLYIETLEFDNFVSLLQQKVAETGGYIESSDISGNSYNYSHNRSASFTCRIPSAKLDGFLTMVDGIGNVTSSYKQQKDVTLSYVDTEARITALQTEYDRLIELLAEAENIDTIISLEERLSEVRYQLESYKSQLRTYDNLIDYSTVEINTVEVKRVSSPEEKTVWARIQSEFGDNLYSVWVGLQDFFVWFVADIPYFVVFAVVIIIVVLIIRLLLNCSPRHRAKVAYKKQEKARKKAEKLAKRNVTAPENQSSAASSENQNESENE